MILMKGLRIRLLSRGVGFQISQAARAYFSYGTGIKNQFFELYGFFDGRFIGNSVLQPEQSESWESAYLRLSIMIFWI